MYSVEPILILHLSDIHFGPLSRFSDEPPNKLGERFSHSVHAELNHKAFGQSISMVVVSGDVAEAARPKEYEDAEVFFGTLAATLGVERRRFVFIPGNHDVSWPACKRAEADQEELGFDDKALRTLIDEKKFQNFESFLDKFYGESRATATGAVALPGGAFVYDFPQLETSIAGLNSCEAESHRRRDHKGLVSEAQAQALMKRWSLDEYSHWLKIIAVHHNPVTTVRENIDEILAQLRNSTDIQRTAVECYAFDMLGFEGRDFLERIAEDCEVQLILHGHHHAADKKLWPWSHGAPAGATHILSAGSGLLDPRKLPRDHPNTLRLISLDPARETIKSWVLEYRPRARARGVVTAGQFVALDEPYERGLSLPKRFPRDRLLKNQATSSMLKVLEDIRMNEFENARKRLIDLEKQFADLSENLIMGILYNRACVESAYAETLPKGDKKHTLALEEATIYLKRWLERGLAGAWAREGKTERNEIHRMGRDSDVRCLLAERRTVFIAFIPEQFRLALPKNLPPKRSSGDGGGCIPGYALIQTPLGSTPAAFIREGDQITSLLLGSPPLFVTTCVAQVHASRTSECVLLNESFLFTASQPLYLERGGLISAANVEIGHRLVGCFGAPILITKKKIISGYYEVYNITTDHQTHNYFAYGSVLCHNKLLFGGDEGMNTWKTLI